MNKNSFLSEFLTRNSMFAIRKWISKSIVRHITLKKKGIRAHPLDASKWTFELFNVIGKPTPSTTWQHATQCEWKKKSCMEATFPRGYITRRAVDRVTVGKTFFFCFHRIERHESYGYIWNDVKWGWKERQKNNGVELRKSFQEDYVTSSENFTLLE